MPLYDGPLPGGWNGEQDWPGYSGAPDLVDAMNSQQSSVIELSPDASAFGGHLNDLGVGYELLNPLDANLDVGTFQKSSTLFPSDVEHSRTAFAVPNIPTFTDTAGCVPQFGLQQDVSNGAPFQGVWDPATLPAPASLQSESALEIQTRQPRTRRAPTGGVPQEEGNRIACNRPGCKATFGREAEFRRHMDTKHNRGQVPGFRCIVCTYEYPRMDKVRSHMEKMHGLRVVKIDGARSA